MLSSLSFFIYYHYLRVV